MNNENNVKSSGWDAIEAEFLRVYPGQTEPKHCGTLINWALGGNDPLDGISIYDGGDYWHFVTFGLSELYEKETEDPEWSGYGFEFTLKLKKYDFEDLEGELKCICGILQSIARITFNSGTIFGANEFIRTGQTTGIDLNQQSEINGFLCISDPTVNTLETPNGRVEFIELVGMSDAELQTLSSRDSVKEIYARLGSDLTDYRRKSIV